MKFDAVAAMLGCYCYYRRRLEKRWVVVVTRRLNGEGFLITAYQTEAIKEGETIWLK